MSRLARVGATSHVVTAVMTAFLVKEIGGRLRRRALLALLLVKSGADRP